MSDDHSSYGVVKAPNGPKARDMQPYIVAFGILFFVVVLIGLALYAGLREYL